jgi:hypothetical protein
MLKRSLIVFLAAAGTFVVAWPAVWLVLDADQVSKTAYATTAAQSTAAVPEPFKMTHAANQTTARILAMDRIRHLAFWTQFLKNKNLACGVVDRTMYRGGTESGVDNWSIRCRNGNEYSVNIEPNAQGAVCTGNAFARSEEEPSQ